MKKFPNEKRAEQNKINKIKREIEKKIESSNFRKMIDNHSWERGTK